MTRNRAASALSKRLRNVLIVSGLLLLISLVGFIVWLWIGLNSGVGYRWMRPANSGDYAFFVDDGFQDSALRLYVYDSQSPQGRLEKVGNLNWIGSHQFDSAVWSQDNSVLAVQLSFVHRARGKTFEQAKTPEELACLAMAYDFKNHHPIISPITDWETLDDLATLTDISASVEALLSSRGGASTSNRLTAEKWNNVKDTVRPWSIPSR